MGQELPTFPEHLSSPPVLKGSCSSIFCFMFCISLFVPLPFLFMCVRVCVCVCVCPLTIGGLYEAIQLGFF